MVVLVVVVVVVLVVVGGVGCGARRWPCPPLFYMLCILTGIDSIEQLSTVLSLGHSTSSGLAGLTVELHHHPHQPTLAEYSANFIGLASNYGPDKPNPVL